MFSIMTSFMTRLTEPVCTGVNAYPTRYATLYHRGQPQGVIEECHRWGIYCRPKEEGGCVCCNAGVPKGTAEEYFSTKAFMWGVYSNPAFQLELKDTVIRARMGARCVPSLSR